MTKEELEQLSEKDRFLIVGIEDGWLEPSNKDLDRYYELTGADIHPIRTMIRKIFNLLVS